MKSISLYVDKDTYLTRMHPFTKLCYILTAVAASLIAGKLWAFAIFIGISLVMLISGKIMKKVFPLIAFSFTILILIPFFFFLLEICLILLIGIQLFSLLL